MARLTAAQRRALPASAFAGPGRTFPVQDKAHAKAALMLVGNAPAAARARIEQKAGKKLRYTKNDLAKTLGKRP